MWSVPGLLVIVLLLAREGVSSRERFANPDPHLRKEWRRLQRVEPAIDRRNHRLTVREKPRDTVMQTWAAKAIPVYNRAVHLLEAEDEDEAVDQFLLSVALHPYLQSGWNNLGTLAFRRGLLAAAVYYAERAVAVDRPTLMTLRNLANIYTSAALHLQKAHDEGAAGQYVAAAVAQYEQATEMEHEGADLLSALRLLRAVGWRERIADLASRFLEKGEMVCPECIIEVAESGAYETERLMAMMSAGLRRAPNHLGLAMALYSVQYQSHDHIGALETAHLAHSISPTSPAVLYSLASSLSVAGRLAEAATYYRKVLGAGKVPSKTRALSTVELANHNQRLCAWGSAEGDFLALRRLLHAELKHGPPSQSPFSCLGYPYRGDEILEAARGASRALEKANSVPPMLRVDGELRVGIATADGGDTNVGRDILGWVKYFAGGVEASGVRVVITLYALRPLAPGAWTDALLDVAREAGVAIHQWPASAERAAELVRGHRIHILINLNGFSKYHRNDVFALHPAPLAVTYKGCASTMGASYIDHLLADPAAIPPSRSLHYHERLIFMPHSFFVTSYPLVWPLPLRTALPDPFPASSIVLCNFNHLNKVTRVVFDVWMAILRRVPHAVLWLLELPVQAKGNLLREVTARGVDAGRVVVTPLYPLRDHLAVKARCNLFLDTPIFNAHGTATDVLWAGVPVLTMPGELYQSRAAYSHIKQLRLEGDLVVR
eukprot:Sspe_Gene.4264::Locus_1406_Transcript_2_2_Confidence_0.750_Length_5425::g.4264::m.4264/K09667/OGT; protein O-GlcNAc transferase